YSACCLCSVRCSPLASLFPYTTLFRSLPEWRDVSSVGKGRAPDARVLHEMEPARPRAVGSPCRKGGEPGQSRDRDVRGTELPLRGRLQREVTEPPAVRREVAPLRVHGAAEPGTAPITRAVEIPRAEMEP